MKSASACGAAALLFSAASAAETEMFEFIPSYDSPDNVVNMSHLLAAPAGRDGRIRVKDGHGPPDSVW